MAIVLFFSTVFCISLQHTHLFNDPLSRTTWVSQYQKGRTNLDFTEARDSEWWPGFLQGPPVFVIIWKEDILLCHNTLLAVCTSNNYQYMPYLTLQKRLNRSWVEWTLVVLQAAAAWAVCTCSTSAEGGQLACQQSSLQTLLTGYLLLPTSVS